MQTEDPSHHASLAKRARELNGVFREVLDTLSDQICVLDESGRVIEVNRAWREFTAMNPPLARNAGVGADYYGVCAAAEGEDAAVAGEALRGLQAVARGELSVFTLEYPCHSPTIRRWFELRATVTTTARPKRLVVAHRDVTQRKEAELALRESQDLYRCMVGTSSDAVLLTSPDGRIHSANQAACGLLGWSEAELVRMRFEDCVDASDSRLAAATEERARTGRFRGELTLLRADGSRFSGQVSSAMFRTSAGELRASMAIRDVTSQKQVEAQLAQSREALRALTQKMDTVREEEQTRIAREIHDELGHAFTDLKLDLAWVDRRLVKAGLKTRCAIRRRIGQLARRMDAYTQIVRRIATALRPAVLDALGLGAAMEWQAREFESRCHVHCSVRIQEGMPVMCSAQVSTLFRILQEILSNIAQHAKASAVTFELSHEAGLIRLCVRDNGCGITPGALANPTALGLLGMRERAAALGGHLTILGVPGEGTTVSVFVPEQYAGNRSRSV